MLIPVHPDQSILSPPSLKPLRKHHKRQHIVYYYWDDCLVVRSLLVLRRPPGQSSLPIRTFSLMQLICRRLAQILPCCRVNPAGVPCSWYSSEQTMDNLGAKGGLCCPNVTVAPFWGEVGTHSRFHRELVSSLRTNAFKLTTLKQRTMGRSKQSLTLVDHPSTM